MVECGQQYSIQFVVNNSTCQKLFVKKQAEGIYKIFGLSRAKIFFNWFFKSNSTTTLGKLVFLWLHMKAPFFLNFNLQITQVSETHLIFVPNGFIFEKYAFIVYKYFVREHKISPRFLRFPFFFVWKFEIFKSIYFVLFIF
jgi:hypothetical protein